MRWTTLVSVSAALPVAATSELNCSGFQGVVLSWLAVLTPGFKQDRPAIATCKLVAATPRSLQQCQRAAGADIGEHAKTGPNSLRVDRRRGPRGGATFADSAGSGARADICVGSSGRRPFHFMTASVASSLSPSPFGALFSTYDIEAPYDEMFERTGRARLHCHALFDELRAASNVDLAQRQMEADKAFLTQGITFAVYGDNEGTERIFPFDLVPRMITASEWDTLERGLTQRLTAINLFIKDVYHERRILAEGVVPRDLLYSCKHYRREMRGVHVHRDIYVSVAGTDLIRLEDGRFVV